MRILQTIHHELDPNSGAPGSTYELWRQYNRLGHASELYSFSNLNPRLPHRAKALIFPVAVAVRGHRRARTHPLDVIEASTGDPWVWSFTSNRRRPVLAVRSHGLEHVVHEHVLAEAQAGLVRLSWKYPLYNGSVHLWEVAVSLRRADLALFSNSYDRAYAIERLGVDAQRAIVVANGVPDSFLSVPLSQTPSMPAEVIRIAQIGSYLDRKGVAYSQVALEEALRENPQIEVRFLGTGCPAALVKASFDPAVRSRVEVIPHYVRADLPALLRDCHIKVLSSFAEGFSHALVEAMACGLAPVVTDIPGNRELVQDGETGLLVPPRDAGALVRALNALVGDRGLLDRLRRAGHAAAQAYSWERLARVRLDLFEERLRAREVARMRPARV